MMRRRRTWRRRRTSNTRVRTKTSKKCAKKKEKENPWKCLEKLEEMSWKRREEARADESMAKKKEADANRAQIGPLCHLLCQENLQKSLKIDMPPLVLPAEAEKRARSY
jgi:hypothetical protein